MQLPLSRPSLVDRDASKFCSDAGRARYSAALAMPAFPAFLSTAFEAIT
jgi:hypothetical protein